MERMVFEVALKGDVESLKRLLDDYPLLLEESMTSVYSYTPLHVAATLGYEDLTHEILKRKPELAKELNSKQSSPLHLAAAMGHAGVVRCLLLADRGMCKARDRDGLTPFHFAAVKGRVEVLKELMSDGHGEICSNELSEVVGMDGEKLGESILQMCVKHGQLEALKFVVEMIGDDADFVNSKDAFGNTVLHLAVEYKQFEAVKFLVQRSRIQVNAENGKGLTAMDTLFQSRNNNNNNNVKEMEIEEALVVRRRDNNSKESENWINEMRGGLMVAASLLATMAFQAVVSPPGGVIDDDDKPIKYELNCIFFGFLYGKEDLCSYENLNDIEYKPIVGTSVMSYYQPAPYTVFMVANTLSFLASVSVILLLISGLPLHRKLFMYIMMIIMWVAITAAAVSYVVCLQMTTKFSPAANILTFIWACLFVTLAVIIGVGYIIKVTVVLIKWLPKVLKKKKNSSSMMYQA